MALQTSGPISLQDIQGEFGGSNPISLSEYYNAASGIPSSGAISLFDFYGASSVTEIVVSTNQADMDLAGYATANGWDGTSALFVTINSGVVVYGSDTSTPALTVSGSFPGGVTIVNSGTIVGDGGDGGDGGAESGSGQNGFDGGTAFFVDSPVSFNNLNTIAGGGGGGGGGGGIDTNTGGGGGGGRSGLVASSGGGDREPLSSRDGQDGTFSNFGAGGGNGGDGGPWGASGQNGGDGSSKSNGGSGGSGGGGGAAVVGNTNVTWINTGTRLGAIS